MAVRPNDRAALPPGPQDRIEADLRFAMIPEWVLYHPDLSDRAVRLYGVLNRHANKHDAAWPSRVTLAEKMHLIPPKAEREPEPGEKQKRPRVDSIDRALAELMKAGAITRRRRLTPAGDPTSSVYTVRSLPTFVDPDDEYVPGEPSGGSRTPAATPRTPAARGSRTGAALTRARLNESQVEPEPPAPEAPGGKDRATSGGGSSPSVPREPATEPPTMSATNPHGDGSAAPTFPDQCTKHQDGPNDQASGGTPCPGCKAAREAQGRAAGLRSRRVRDELHALEEAPECVHGTPGGARPNPADPARLPLCALCRAGVAAEADLVPTRDDSDALRRILGQPATSTVDGVTPSAFEMAGARDVA